MEETIYHQNTIIEKQDDLVFTENIKSHLLIFAKWGRFIAIVTCVASILMILIGFSFLFIGQLSSNIPAFGGVIYKIFMFILFLIYGGLYAVIGFLLLRATSSIKLGIINNNQKTFENGTYNLQNLFRLLGILTIIRICIYALVIIIMGISYAFISPILN